MSLLEVRNLGVQFLVENRLVEAVQRKGVRVTVVSTARSSPPMAADELRRQADCFVELQDLANSIQRKGRPTPPVMDRQNHDMVDEGADDFDDGDDSGLAPDSDEHYEPA